MLAKIPAHVHTGSYSTGTLRPQDLGPIMLGLLLDLHAPSGHLFEKNWPNVIKAGYDAEKLANSDDPDQIVGAQLEVEYAMTELEEHIDCQLPRGLRWGSHPGDGADIGIWGVWVDGGQDDTADGQDDTPPDPPAHRRRYVAEQATGNLWGVVEGQDGTLVKRVGHLTDRVSAETWAGALNDAIHQFMVDNGIEVPDA